MSVTPRRSWSRGKKIRVGLCVAAVAWLACELVIAVIVKTNPAVVWQLGLRRPGDGPSLFGREAFHQSYMHEFDAELGWDHPPPGPPRDAAGPPALVTTYGDSFTECTGPYELTWETLLAQALHADVTNFGVGGYGTDQALLKLERLYPRHRSPIVLFGFLSRDISRLVNVYGYARLIQETRTFLLNGKPYFMPTKPRFVLTDGKLALIENPVKTEDDFLRLVFDPGFAPTLAAGDYFKEGYDLDRYCPQVSFPYLWTLSRAAWLRARSRGPAPDYASILMRDDATRELFTAILDGFVGLSRRESFRGVIVIFGEADELSYYLGHGKHLRLDPIVRYLREHGYAYIDTIDLLSRHQKATKPAESISLYFDVTGHHSAYAHKIIADGIARYLGVAATAPATRPSPHR